VAADAKATFAVELEDGTSSTAKSAASELKKLKDQITADTRALADMQKAMKNLQAGSSVNIQQFRDLKAQIDAKKQSIAQAQGAFVSLGGTFGKSAGEGKKVASMFELLRERAGMMPGPLGSVVSQLGSLKSMLAGGARVLGLAALAAAMVAVTVAAIAGTAALLSYGVAQADARRNELLHLEGLTKLRFWYSAAAGSASELQGAIDRVSDGVALGRDEIGRYTEKLYRMGLRGKNLEDALEGVAIKAAVQGDAAASAFAGWAAGAALAGGSVRKLTDDVKARLGGIAAAQMLSLGVQAKKMRENFGVLFRDLKVEGLLKTLKIITDTFSQSTASGRALKALLETAFQPMVNAVEFLGPYVKRFFQGVVIGALLVGIAVLKVRNWFKRTFGDAEILKGFDATKSALYAGVAAVGLLGAAFAGMAALAVGALVVLTPIVWSAVAAVGALALSGLAMAAPFILGAIAIGALIAAGYQLYRLWKEIDWTSLGRSIVDGIVGGLTAGIQWVKDAMRSLGDAALGSFKEALQIASPSKVFAKVGLAIPEGVEQGVDAGKRDVDDAVKGMVTAPSGGGAGGGAAAPVTITFGDIIIQSASEKGREIAEDVERVIEGVMERVAIQLGAASQRAV
jgi:hypothetical protein